MPWGTARQRREGSSVCGGHDLRLRGTTRGRIRLWRGRFMHKNHVSDGTGEQGGGTQDKGVVSAPMTRGRYHCVRFWPAVPEGRARLRIGRVMHRGSARQCARHEVRTLTRRGLAIRHVEAGGRASARTGESTTQQPVDGLSWELACTGARGKRASSPKMVSGQATGQATKTRARTHAKPQGGQNQTTTCFSARV